MTNYRQIHGHSERDPDRARVAVEAVLEISGLPKNIKKALKDHVNWSPERVENSHLHKSAQKMKL